VTLLFAVSSVGKAADGADHARGRSVVARNLALDITALCVHSTAHTAPL
jgi:hypothetical protein